MLATPMIQASLYMDNGPDLTGCQIGYDLSLPRRLGLYRMALMQKVRLAHRRLLWHTGS